ncbi:MAG: histidinol-phosphate transaminase [Candidatus Hinthialibacter antarcticus]|nr:histidinol-phosphate transaminase [Candidatus Hinthialibacter antarcticus]
MPTMPPRIDIPTYWRERDAVYLHLGENPLPPTENVQRAIAAAAQHANRYPDTNCLALRKKLALYVGGNVKPENIIVGNGSDELIDLATVAFTEEGQSVATFEPSFFVYRFAAQRHNRKVARLERTVEFDLPNAQSITSDSALTFIANPNNPTGTLTARGHLLAVLDSLPGVKVIDECYFEFSGETVVDLIHERDDLIIFRSLSKSFSLAGLRIGYAIASGALIERLASFALTFPVNIIAQAAAVAALNDVDEMKRRVAQLIEQRDWLAGEMRALGAETLPSYANFILTLWPRDAGLADKLRAAGIFVSNQSANIGGERVALRIGVGTREENQRVVDALKQ